MIQSTPELDDVRAFLVDLHGAPIDALDPLSGGFWSRAFAYRALGEDRVVRFGTDAAWFEADRRAIAFSGPDLPVPAVHHIGESPWGPFAISTRHFGVFLEDVPDDLATNLDPTLQRLLVALYRAPRRDDPVLWHAMSTGPRPSWRDWLLDGLVDRTGKRVHGWRTELANWPKIDRVFRATADRVHQLVPDCPERRDLVHGDLLHKNVLVDRAATSVEAVFSWKCSVRGDFLFDTAWCDFWSAWHPGIAAANPINSFLRALQVAGDDAALQSASERLHCYRLQIGATHLGWSLHVHDDEALQRIADRLERELDL